VKAYTNLKMHNTHKNHNLQNIECYYQFAQFSSCEINTIAPDDQQHLCTFRRQSVASTCVHEAASHA